MTMVRGNSALVPQRPTDCVSVMRIRFHIDRSCVPAQVEKQSPLMPRCEHITAEHREYRNCVKFPSSHAEMIADQANSKAYTNRTNSAALAGASDVVFD
jgi:hypothetical protein